eukprot:8525756-Heterocapsa_arctica.AAC.1
MQRRHVKATKKRTPGRRAKSCGPVPQSCGAFPGGRSNWHLPLEARSRWPVPLEAVATKGA